jgi:hypothetical protein
VFGNQHYSILRRLVALIHRVSLVKLGQPALTIIDLLPKSECRLVGIDFLEIAGQPSDATWHVMPVAPATSGQVVPLAELLFVLHARAHDGSLSGAAMMLPSDKV